MEMVVPIVVGLLMDRWLGTTPWLMVGGVVLGFVGGFAHLMAILQRIDRTDAEKPRDRP
jgi:F0F1-type ATP synthase assembly protein I